MPEEHTTTSNGDPNEEPPPKGTLPLDDVGRLVELLAGSGVGEIQVRQGDLEIVVKARTEAHVEPIALPHVPRVETEPEPNGAVERDGGLHVLRSPLVGTFYRAPRPGEEPYVGVGERVEAGQTLCIVEAMKLMNEIPADVPGEVVEVMVENARGVEYDQPLFRIRPEA